MFRSADKLGNPVRKGIRENIAAEAEVKDAREAEEAMRRSLRMQFEAQKK